MPSRLTRRSRRPSDVTAPDQPAPRAACARCGAAISCEPAGDCWCKHEPVRLPMPAAGEGCLCADCLRKAAEARA